MKASRLPALTVVLVPPSPCITCSITASHPELVVWDDDLIVVNHYLDESDLRTGWLVTSPKRHITR